LPDGAASSAISGKLSYRAILKKVAKEKAAPKKEKRG
jgi:hypothetical protein